MKGAVDPQASLVEKAVEVASVIDTMRRRSEPYGGPRADLERDPRALAAALDELRLQHEELLVADEELRVQLQELERVNEIIAFERARAQHVFVHAPDAYLVTDPNGIVEEANLAAFALFERDFESLVKRAVTTLVAHDDGPIQFGLLAAAREGLVSERRIRIRFRDDARALVATHAIVSRIGDSGSVFWRFRRVDVEEARPKPVVRPPTPAKDAPRVLVISHDDDTRAIVDVVAGGISADVRATDTVFGAVEILREFRADILVCDLFIQTPQGADIITELRMRNHRPMPLGIAVSGVSSSGSRVALAAGFHAFLTKPVTVESVKSAFHATMRILAKRNKRKTSEP